MADIASLTFTVDSNPVRRAGDDLRRLGSDAKQAERSVKDFDNTTAATTQALRRAGDDLRRLGIDVKQTEGSVKDFDNTTASTTHTLRRAGDDLRRLSNDAKQTEKSVKDFDNTTAATTQMLRRFATVAGGAFAGIKLGGLIRDTAMLNSRYEQLGNIMEVVGRNAGLSADEVNKQAEAVRAMGITMAESRQTITTMIQAQLDLSRASELARVAQDAAAIAGVNSTEALGRLMNGIQSANTQVLRGVGINVQFEQGYRAMAEQLGKTAEELTESERAQSRMNQVLDAGVQIAGAYEASMDSAAKQLGSTARYVEDIQVMFGEVFSEANRTAVFAYSDALKSVLNITENLYDSGALSRIGRSIEYIDEVAQLAAFTLAARLTPAIGASLVRAMQAAVGAFATTTTTTYAYNSALMVMEATTHRVTGAQRLMAGAMGTARSALALIGGPAGAAVLAAGAIFTFREELGLVPYNADKATQALGRLTGGIESLTYAQAQYRKLELEKALDRERFAVTKLQSEVDVLVGRLERNPRLRFSESLQEQLLAARANLDSATQSVQNYEQALADVEDQIARAYEASDQFVGPLQQIADTAEDVEEGMDGAGDSVRTFTGELITGRDAVEDMIAAWERKLELERMSARERALSIAIEEAGLGVTLQQAAALREAIDAYYDFIESQKSAKDDSDRLNGSLRDATAAMASMATQADQTSTAVNNMLENIQREWANTFYNMDFTAKGFFGSVTDGFRRMLSEMASKDLVNAVLRGGGMSAITGGSIAGLISGGSQFLGGVLGRGAGIAAGTMGPPTAAAASGASMGAFLTNPWTIGIAGALLAADRLTSGDGKVRLNAGMFVGNTPGADPSRTFAVDPFASGLNVTGFARRAEQDKAREVIDIFREIDSGLSEIVRELGGTLDLTQATLAGLDEEARTGSQGTFLGLGGLNELAGDLDYQVQMFFDQLVDHIGGLDDDLLAAVRAAGSVEAAFEVMTQAMADNVEIQERVSGVLSRVDSEMERVFRDLGATAMQPLDLFMESLSQLEHSAAVARVHELVDSMFGLDAALVETVLSTNDLAEIANILGSEMERVARVAQNVDFGPMVSDLNRAIAAEVGALESELEALIAAEQARLDQMQTAYDAQEEHWRNVARIEQERAQWSQEAARTALQAEQEIHRQRLGSIRSQQSLLRDRARETQGILSQLERALDQFGFGRDEEFSASRAQAMQTLRGMIGGRIDAEALSGALGVATQDSSRLYSTFVDFARDQGVTANLIAQLSEQTEDQLTAEERQIAALDRAQEIAEKNYEALRREHEEAMEQAKADAAAAASWSQYEMEVERAQFEEAKKQAEQRIAEARKQHAEQVSELERQRNMALQEIEIQEGTYRAVISVREALENIYSAMTPASNDPVFDSLDDDEGFARGGIASGPSTGYSATLHGTEAIVPLPDGRSIPAVVTSDANTAAALNDIIRELNGVLEATRATAMHSSKTARTIERWEFDGMPEERDVI